MFLFVRPVSTTPGLHRRRPASRRGAAAVEFAIVAPLLVLLVFGMIEFGRVMMAMELLNNAARNGARAAVINGSSTTNVSNSVTQTLTNTTITGATTTVSVNGTATTDVSTARTGDTVSVSVSVAASAVSWLPVLQFTSGKTLTATATMRRE